MIIMLKYLKYIKFSDDFRVWVRVLLNSGLVKFDVVADPIYKGLK